MTETDQVSLTINNIIKQTEPTILEMIEVIRQYRIYYGIAKMTDLTINDISILKQAYLVAKKHFTLKKSIIHSLDDYMSG